MAGNTTSHPSFVCREPFDQEQVTCFDARYFAGSTINPAKPYPTVYLVGAMVMWVMCSLLTRASLDLPTVLAWSNPSWGREWWSSSTSSTLEERSLSSMQLGWLSLGVHVSSLWRTPGGVEGYPQWSGPLQPLEDGNLRLEGEERPGSCCGSWDAFSDGVRYLFATSNSGVGKEGTWRVTQLRVPLTSSLSVIPWNSRSMMPRRR